MPLLTSSRRLQIHRGNTWFIPRRNLNSSSEFIARAVGSDSRRISGVTRELIVLNSALTLVLGLATCVLKLALVPMKEYPFFSSSGYYFWNLNSSRKFYVRAVGGDSGRISDVTTELILLNSALTLVLGVANQVLYKLALVLMKEYPFFLALVTTLGSKWRQNLESKGFKLSRTEIEYLECKFSDASRDANVDVMLEIQVIPREQVSSKFHRVVVKPIMLYGTEWWPFKNSHVQKLRVTVMRMLKWMCGLTRRDKIRNKVIHAKLGVPSMEDKIREAKLYLAIYLSILYARYRAGIVTKERVAYLKSRFLLVGLLEALGVVCGMYAGAVLPGPAIPILSQGISKVILESWHSDKTVADRVRKLAFVIMECSGSDSNQMLAGIAFVWPVLMVASSAFQAAASVIKGKVLDIFVVNSFGSGFQGIPFSELPSFLKSGAGCFFNIGNIVSGSDPLLYFISEKVNKNLNKNDITIFSYWPFADIMFMSPAYVSFSSYDVIITQLK
ncbi:putative crt -like protein 3-like isoform X2 [Capsicum annuum]|nr:putative crt -like protein 3-like isoform X2 [Capsicum annuum]